MSTQIKTLEDFAAWCRQQGDREYEFIPAETCACGQYAAARGVFEEWMSRGSTDFWYTINALAQDMPRAFSALADRVEAEIAKQPDSQ